jgi:hypothetical protein
MFMLLTQTSTVCHMAMTSAGYCYTVIVQSCSRQITLHRHVLCDIFRNMGTATNPNGSLWVLASASLCALSQKEDFLLGYSVKVRKRFIATDTDTREINLPHVRSACDVSV